MTFSHAAVLEIKSLRSTLVAFSTMYPYGEKKIANVKGYFKDYYQSKGGGYLGDADVYKKTIKSQLSLKTFPKIVKVQKLLLQNCCMTLSHAAVL